jgi:predicted small secreted protein
MKSTIIITRTSCEDCKPTKSRIYAIAMGVALVLVAGGASSCGTARGFGQDVEETGDQIQEAATR